MKRAADEISKAKTPRLCRLPRSTASCNLSARKEEAREEDARVLVPGAVPSKIGYAPKQGVHGNFPK